jgi:hypothetical protein
VQEGTNPKARAIMRVVFAASQQRLAVQPDGVTTVKVSVLAGRGNGTNRAGPTRSQHRKAPNISAAAQSARAISHRGPERQPNVTTGQITNMIIAANMIRRRTALCGRVSEA